MKKHQSRGFTLVELLVVVGIIALLVAILVPAIQGARAVAKQAVCAGNLKQIVYATQMYADDTDGRYPQYGGFPMNLRWYERLLPYMQLAEYDYDEHENTALGSGQFTCPEDSDPRDFFYYPKYPLGMYGLNDAITLKPTIKVSSGTAIYGDSGALVIWPGIVGYYAFTEDRDGDGKNDTSTLAANNSTKNELYIYGWFRPFRHPSGGNIAYGDSHVSTVTVDQWVDNYQNLWGE